MKPWWKVETVSVSQKKEKKRNDREMEKNENVKIAFLAIDWEAVMPQQFEVQHCASFDFTLYAKGMLTWSTPGEFSGEGGVEKYDKITVQIVNYQLNEAQLTSQSRFSEQKKHDKKLRRVGETCQPADSWENSPCSDSRCLALQWQVIGWHTKRVCSISPAKPAEDGNCRLTLVEAWVGMLPKFSTSKYLSRIWR